MDDNRSPSFEENGLKKGPWTPDEDEKLIQHIQKHGLGSWRALPKLAGLNRCGKSCRLRWTNYLRPDIKRGKFSEDEEQMILHLHSILGNKWSAIATHLPGRTDNEIKNFWNTHLKKKLIQMGFDPMTHQPRSDLMVIPNLPHLMALANLKHHLLMKNNPVDIQLLHSLLLLQSNTPTNDMIQQNGGNDVVPADHHQTEVPLFMENNPGLFSNDHHDDHEYNNYYYYHDGSSSTSTTSPQPLHQYPDLLSHPDPQKVSFSFQPSLNNDHDHLDHEPEIIMGQQQSNISDHSFSNMISTDGLQGDYPPHDHDHHDHHDDHDSASTWFLPPLSPSSSNLPNLIECEGLVCNNINITPAGDHATSSTTTNLHWPAELFHDDSI